jgi:hypothetical protein
MKKLAKTTLLALLLFVSPMLKAQVLISLLFGEALNTPRIEFGMVGGLNRSYLTGLSGSEGLNHFNLGFYFHVNIKNNSFISTGVLVKSNVGATGMNVYSTGIAEIDTIYKDGTLTKKISCFYVPILYHHRFNNRWYLEAGPQAGLRTKATDIFEKSTDDSDLRLTTDVKDEYTRLDFGLTAGAGYKFKKELKSMAVGINYYYGLVDVNKNPDVSMQNASLNFYMKIPIGLGAKPTEVK